jgi:hypothetical protein
VSRKPTLDSFGELYPGFILHKRMLRAWRTDADELWVKSFLRLGRTEKFLLRSDEDIAVETMRILLDSIPRRRRRALRRAVRKGTL